VTCFRLIDAKRAQHPVSLLCSVLGVSRAGYYAWKDRPRSERARCDDELLEQIRAIHAESRGTYGWPRVHAELRHRGVRVSRKRVARLMRAAGLSGMVRRRKGRTTVSLPGITTAPDRVRRDFAPAAPNRLWVADLTEIATWEGKLYLAVVVDCFSRRCVGWAMADHMRAELVVEALEMALWQRRPAVGLVHHSDRGGQYVSLIFGQTARAAGIDVSMGAKGCALDNAVCESFFATLKKELTRRRSWPTRRELESTVFAWIEGWYNRRRLHSTLGYLSPVDYENRTLGQRGADLAASRLAHSDKIMIKEKAA
jgi:putative transposase